jgi:hypothetical protein
VLDETQNSRGTLPDMGPHRYASDRLGTDATGRAVIDSIDQRHKRQCEGDRRKRQQNPHDHHHAAPNVNLR